MIYSVQINENMLVLISDVQTVSHEVEHTIMRNDRKEIVGIFKNAEYQFLVKQTSPTIIPNTVDYLAQARFFNNG